MLRHSFSIQRACLSVANGRHSLPSGTAKNTSILFSMCAKNKSLDNIPNNKLDLKIISAKAESLIISRTCLTIHCWKYFNCSFSLSN